MVLELYRSADSWDLSPIGQPCRFGCSKVRLFLPSLPFEMPRVLGPAQERPFESAILTEDDELCP